MRDESDDLHSVRRIDPYAYKAFLSVESTSTANWNTLELTNRPVLPRKRPLPREQLPVQ